MQYNKFTTIPQSVFSSQKDDERIFVIARRHIISFLSWQIITILLFLVPIIFLIIGFDGILNLVASFPVYIDDLIILAVMIFYLSLILVFMTNWVRYYYTYLIVTDSRVYTSRQVGFFNRTPHEFTLDEVQECPYKIRGILGIIFNIGDILVHFEGSAQEDYKIQAVFKANVISMIISSLSEQAKQGVAPKERHPKNKIIGLIENKEITSQEDPPAIMNFQRSIKEAQQKIAIKTSQPKGLRKKFDLWWWSQLKKEHGIYIDYEPSKLKEVSQGKKGESGKAKKD